MARRKKSEPQYYLTGATDNLIRIAWKTGAELEKLRVLNPTIRSASAPLKMGLKVRIV